MSTFGSWGEVDGLPVFHYTADPDATPAATWDPLVAPVTNRHWVSIGNRRLCLWVANDGTVALRDEHDGLRWLTAPDPSGTGVTEVVVDGARHTSARDGGAGEVHSVEIGPTWCSSSAMLGPISVRRTVQLPEGEAGHVVVQVELTNATAADIEAEVAEVWALRPRMINLGHNADVARATAERTIAYDVVVDGSSVTASERWAEPVASGLYSPTHGEPRVIRLEVTRGHEVLRDLSLSGDGRPHPTLRAAGGLHLGPGQTVVVGFSVGLPSTMDGPADIAATRAALRRRLPVASGAGVDGVAHEVTWHAALLSGGACVDGVLGGHTLDQASAYSYTIGFNGAARDPLQHALPLIYSEPDLALSVLRNTSAWATPDGDLPYALDGGKTPWTSMWQPSDQNLWALWLAAEYAAATGDLAAFGAELAYHPAHGAEPASLGEHLRRQFRFFVDGVGLGANGHVRIRNADWNDMAISTSGVPHDQMVAEGESVLNSAMAAWVLPVYAGLADRLGDAATAEEARRLGEQLRQAVAGEWNGRWFRRAYGPGVGPIGDADCWLEVQPWALLCGAAKPDEAEQLLRYIDSGPRSASPLGARVRWPVQPDGGALGGAGDGTNGGVWFSINMTLVWAASKVDPDLAWDEWHRMSLRSHTAAHPDIWEGTLSGPDAYNGPESERAGRTWGSAALGVAMQSWPVNNMHSHAQPLLSYLRLLGVEPLPSGALRADGPAGGRDARFESATFAVGPDGGRLFAVGEVTVQAGSRTETGTGELRW